MSESVNGLGRWNDAEPPARQVHVPEHVPTPKPLPLLAGEYEVPLVELLPPIELPSQFKPEGDRPVLPPLPWNFNSRLSRSTSGHLSPVASALRQPVSMSKRTKTWSRVS